MCNAEFISELSVIKRHSNSIKHLNRLKGKDASQSNIFSHFKSASTGISSTHEENVKTAEIKLCGFIAEHNISFLTMDHLCPLLSTIFPDSNIAKDLAVRRTKSKAIVTNIISHSHKNELATILRNTKFNILTDESTDISTNKSACIVVKYFDNEKNKIETNLWELISIHDNETKVHKQGTAEHLFHKIIDTFYKHKVPTENIIGFGSDGCNVMMGQFNSVASRFKVLCPDILSVYVNYTYAAVRHAKVCLRV